MKDYDAWVQAHSDGWLDELKSCCPACGEPATGIHLREIQAVTYAYDPATGHYRINELVSPDVVGWDIRYDDEHPEVTAVCSACGHEWRLEA
jgi:hypothetical protein